MRDRGRRARRSELPEPTSDREEALVRLEKRRDLTAHLVSYLVVSGMLWAICDLPSPRKR
jgi:hypothetical protein